MLPLPVSALPRPNTSAKPRTLPVSQFSKSISSPFIGSSGKGSGIEPMELMISGERTSSIWPSSDTSLPSIVFVC